MSYENFGADEPNGGEAENYVSMFGTSSAWSDNPGVDETIHVLCCNSNATRLNETGFSDCDPCVCSYSHCNHVYLQSLDRPRYTCSCPDSLPWYMMLILAGLISGALGCICCIVVACWRRRTWAPRPLEGQSQPVAGHVVQSNVVGVPGSVKDTFIKSL